MQIKRKKLNTKVKRDFQFWLFSRTLLLVLLCSMIAAGVLYFYGKNEIISNYYSAHVKMRSMSDMLLPVILVAFLFSLLCSAFVALFLPQRIAGPVYRIEKGLQAVQEGDYQTEIKLRKNDPLHDLAESINKTIAVFRDRINKEE